MSKVSIVIPVYNVEKYLRECLDSVVNQTLKDIEIICINDGSTDSSGKILDEYAQKDLRIKVIHKENGGYGKSMNVGLDNATGEYIGIVEPDDYVELDMYDKLYNVAKENNSDVVKSLFITNYQAPRRVEMFKNYDFENVPSRSFEVSEYPILLRFHPSVWSCIYKKDFLVSNKIRFVEAPGAGWTDNPFFIQTMCLAKRINILKEYCYYWRNLSNTDSEALRDYTLPFDRLNEIYDWLNSQKITDTNILCEIYRRTIVYAKIVLGMKNISNLFDCFDKIKKVFQRIDEKVYLKSNDLSSSDKRLYWGVVHFGFLYLMYFRFTKMFMEKIFFVSKNNRHKIITILGIRISIRRKNGKS
jgi:glycosyltransferase involved in cell wall biosynthesis